MNIDAYIINICPECGRTARAPKYSTFTCDDWNLCWHSGDEYKGEMNVPGEYQVKMKTIFDSENRGK